MKNNENFFLINYESFGEDIKELYINTFYKQIKDPIGNNDCFGMFGFNKYYVEFESHKKEFLEIGNKILKNVLGNLGFKFINIIKDYVDDDLLYLEYNKEGYELKIYISPVLNYCKIVLYSCNDKKYQRLYGDIYNNISKILKEYGFGLLNSDLLEKELSLFLSNLGNKTLYNFIELNDLCNNAIKMNGDETYKIKNLQDFKNSIYYKEGEDWLEFWGKEMTKTLAGPLKLKHFLFGDSTYLTYIPDFRELEVCNFD